jgi:hypothetical protein
LGEPVKKVEQTIEGNLSGIVVEIINGATAENTNN